MRVSPSDETSMCANASVLVSELITTVLDNGSNVDAAWHRQTRKATSLWKQKRTRSES